MRRAVRSRAFQLTPAGYRTHRRVSIFGRIYGGTARKHEEEAARKAAGRCTRSRSRDSSLFWNLADDNTRARESRFLRSRKTKEGLVCRHGRSLGRWVGRVLSQRAHRCCATSVLFNFAIRLVSTYL